MTLKNTTRDELLNIYIRVINRIDDYFEYKYESEKDKEVVMNIISSIQDQLTKEKK